jgi:MinD superfamily P-loop ATPase
MAVPVIRELKHWQLLAEEDKVIIDAPPGTSCPVVESVRDADFVLLVTEPTPFGLHDLRLAAKLTRELNLPAGVVINRDGVGDSGVIEYCQSSDLPILMRIPLERRIGEAIARGQTLVEAFPEYLPRFRQLYDQILLLSDRREPRNQSNVKTQPSDGAKVRSQ